MTRTVRCEMLQRETAEAGTVLAGSIRRPPRSGCNEARRYRYHQNKRSAAQRMAADKKGGTANGVECSVRPLQRKLWGWAGLFCAVECVGACGKFLIAGKEQI